MKSSRRGQRGKTDGSYASNNPRLSAFMVMTLGSGEKDDVPSRGPRATGRPLPAAVLAVSPWFDTELKNPTVDCNADTDKLLSRSLLEFFRDCWLGGTGVAYDDPGVNPLYAELAGLPPVSVYYGEHELLAGEAIEFADRAKGAALDVHLHAVAEGQHSFILGAGRVPEADQAIAEMGRWLRSKLGLAVLADT